MKEADLIVIDEAQKLDDESIAAVIDEDAQEPQIAEGGAHITENADGTRTLRLRRPIEVVYRGPKGERRETLRDLTFRRVTGGDLRAVAGVANEQERGIRLMCRLCDISLAVFDRLDGEDIQGCSEVIEGFLPESRKTGKTSSAQ